MLYLHTTPLAWLPILISAYPQWHHSGIDFIPEFEDPIPTSPPCAENPLQVEVHSQATKHVLLEGQQNCYNCDVWMTFIEFVNESLFHIIMISMGLHEFLVK